MTTAQVGIKSGNVIVPYVSTTKQSRLLNISSYVTGDANWTTSYATAMFSADSNGAWKIEFNITGTQSNATATTSLTIAGVTFKAGPYQACTFSDGNTNPGSVQTTPNTGILVLKPVNATTTRYANGNVDLNAEPTWASLGTTALAALEGVIAADVYIANATSISAGLLDYYDTGTFTAYISDGNAVSAAMTVPYTRLGKLVSLHLGSYSIASNLTNRWISTSSTPATKTWPASLTPASSRLCWVVLRTGTGTYTFGQMAIASTGIVTLFIDALGNTFTTGNSEAKGVEPTTITYTL